MALNNSVNEKAPESVNKVQEHNEMRGELVAAGFESFGLAAQEGLLAKNKDGKIVYLRDNADGYSVFAADELPDSEPLPRSMAVSEATKRLSA